MPYSWIALLLGVSFFLGSVPYGLIIARLMGVQNVRATGSGNTGATNVSRSVGVWPGGVLTFLLDCGKGSLAVFLCGPVGGAAVLDLLGSVFGLHESGRNWALVIPTQQEHLFEIMSWAGGLFVVLGHCFSPFLRLSGGKGVATGFGAMLLLSPVCALIGLGAFGLTLWQRGIVSLASLSGLLVMSVAHIVLYPAGVHLVFLGALVMVILIRHEANLEALLENREKPFRA